MQEIITKYKEYCKKWEEWYVKNLPQHYRKLTFQEFIDRLIQEEDK